MYVYIYALIINYVPNVDISLISASSFIANQLSQDPWTLEPNKSNDLRKCPERCGDPTINILFQDLQYLCHGSTGGCNRDKWVGWVRDPQTNWKSNVIPVVTGILDGSWTQIVSA